MLSQLTQKGSVPVKYLYPVVIVIRHPDISILCIGHAVGTFKLSRAGSTRSKFADEGSVQVIDPYLVHTAVTVPHRHAVSMNGQTIRIS